MVSSFDPHSMCAKVEMITAKTGCTSCTNWTNSFKVQGFQTKTHLLQRHFIFLSLFQLKTFLHPTCNIQSHILKFQPFLTSFAIFMHLMIYFQLNDLEIEKGSNLNSGKVETLAWCHNLTHITCVQNLRGLRQKLDALRVQTGLSLSKYEGFTRKLMCYKDISFF